MTDTNTPANDNPCGATGASSMAFKLQDTLIENSLEKIRHKLIIMSGKGGVGKSSIAANIAVALAHRNFQVGLMDVDLHGPSIARMMGLDGLLEITDDRFAVPKPFHPNLGVVSMQSLMPEPDQAVIWRGPAKTGVIRQFIADVRWGERDFLIIDAPPGTGDEPLSVARTVPDAKAVIVTTPQDVALSDVRKSIGFCRIVHMEILGLIENMGPFPCPCCGKIIDIFRQGGGEKTASQMGIPFLGTIPFDPAVVSASDSGHPALNDPVSSSFSEALTRCVDGILAALPGIAGVLSRHGVPNPREEDMTMKKVVALEARLRACRNVMTLGVRPNFSDYTEEEADLIRGAQKIYYPTTFYADLFDAAGIPTFPSYHTYKCVQDKIKQTALFELLEIPHPRTRVYYGKRQQQRIPDLFQYPFVGKIPRGSAMGRGVFFIDRPKTLEHYLSQTSVAYIQEYLPIDRDIRVVVIGGDAVHAYRRIAPEGEFRSNVAVGARIELEDIPEAAVHLALETARKCQWDDVGIDICSHKDGYVVLEGNMKYGKEGFRAAGMDYVKEMERKIDNGEI